MAFSMGASSTNGCYGGVNPLPDSVGGGPTSQPLWDGFRFIKDMIQKMGSDGLLINISSVTHIIKRLNVASIYIYIYKSQLLLGSA